MPGDAITFKVSDDGDIAYLYLPEHPGGGAQGASAKQVRLADLIKYAGADVYFDFDAQGNLIGIEVMS